MIERERLLQKVGGAEFHSFDSQVYGAVRGDDDSGRRQAARLQLLDKLQTVDARQTQVGDDQIGEGGEG